MPTTPAANLADGEGRRVTSDGLGSIHHIHRDHPRTLGTVAPPRPVERYQLAGWRRGAHQSRAAALRLRYLGHATHLTDFTGPFHHMKGLHNRRGDRRRPRAYGIPRMDILDERLREAAPPSPRSPQKSRNSDLLTRFRMVSSPGRSRDTIERRRGTPPGPSTPSGRPRRAKGRPCDIPG